MFANSLHQTTMPFHKSENDLNVLIGYIPLRDLNFCGKQVIGYLNTSYIEYIGRYIPCMMNNYSMSRINVALVIGMCNYGSSVATECIRQFRKIKLSTGNLSEEDDHEETTQVFALTFGENTVINNNTLNT